MDRNFVATKILPYAYVGADASRMEIEFDPAKDVANRAKHGVGLDAFADLDLSQAMIFEDDREDYGEPRFIGYAPPKGRLHVFWYTWRKGKVRVIGLRKANARERKRYEQRA